MIKVLFLLITFAPALAIAQAWPAKPIRLIVGYAPGGGADAMARTLAAKMQPLLGQPLVLDFRPGAGGAVALQAGAAAAPDGYTLQLSDSGPLTIAPVVSKVPYDPVSSFTPIGLVATGCNVIIAHPAFPAGTVAELVARAKEQQGHLVYGTSGTASVRHLSAEMLQALAGVRMVHVPYKGGGPAMTDLLGGHIPLVFSSLGSAVPYIKSGQVKAIGVTCAARVPVIAEVPTVAEQGYPGFEASLWYGLFGPAKLPAEIAAKTSRALVAALQDKEVQDAVRLLGYDPSRSTPAQLGAAIGAELEKWRKVVREANLKPE